MPMEKKHQIQHLWAWERELNLPGLILLRRKELLEPSCFLMSCSGVMLTGLRHTLHFSPWQIYKGNLQDISHYPCLKDTENMDGQGTGQPYTASVVEQDFKFHIPVLQASHCLQGCKGRHKGCTGVVSAMWQTCDNAFATVSVGRSGCQVVQLCYGLGHNQAVKIICQTIGLAELIRLNFTGLEQDYIIKFKNQMHCSGGGQLWLVCYTWNDFNR